METDLVSCVDRRCTYFVRCAKSSGGMEWTKKLFKNNACDHMGFTYMDCSRLTLRTTGSTPIEPIFLLLFQALLFGFMFYQNHFDIDSHHLITTTNCYYRR